MSIITPLRRGESLDFCFDLGGEPITDWICTMEVRMYTGDDAEISRVIEPDTSNRSWPGFLTSSETAGLSSVGTYRILGILTNATTEEQRQVTGVRFNLTESWGS